MFTRNRKLKKKSYIQYLNCKILHVGTLLQPWPNAFEMQKYFSGNYVFPSPKSSVDQKKERPLPKIKEFLSPKSSKEQNKGLHRNLGLNSAGICGIYSCRQALLRLINQRSNLNLDKGTLTLDGGKRPPYNLSTGYISIPD